VGQGFYETRGHATEVLDEIGGTKAGPTKVWSLPLTPELKKALLKGGVTFGVAAAALDQDNETVGLLKKPRK